MDEEEFRIVSGFLADHVSQVEGRGAVRLSTDDEQTLCKLAAGELDKKTIEDLLPLLRDNSMAIAFLADQIKSRRAVSRPSANSAPPSES